MLPSADSKPNIGLFVTCLVDLFRPSIGFASVKLLEKANCTVFVPEKQTCCGQPAYNNGDFSDTRAIAKKVIAVFKNYDYIVLPSGSCAGMIKKHYPALFKEDEILLKEANDLSNRTYELISFLTDVLHIQSVDAEYENTATYHDACSGLRELNIKEQPRKLLSSVKGLRLHELPESTVCCGFGGTFCVKYPDISNKMVTDKATAIQATGAHTLLAGDLGCLLNMAGKLKRLNSPVKTFHIAEILANMTETPAIGEGHE
ncbi:MAG: hypothetical protein ACD_60C00025G0068 [uncultured bacterium]|nr:MAG: hypothetical protein ACD_60C00025G0068 [uncultured bacterium]